MIDTLQGMDGHSCLTNLRYKKSYKFKVRRFGFNLLVQTSLTLFITRFMLSGTMLYPEVVILCSDDKVQIYGENVKQSKKKPVTASF